MPVRMVRQAERRSTENSCLSIALLLPINITRSLLGNVNANFEARPQPKLCLVLLFAPAPVVLTKIMWFSWMDNRTLFACQTLLALVYAVAFLGHEADEPPSARDGILRSWLFLRLPRLHPDGHTRLRP